MLKKKYPDHIGPTAREVLEHLPLLRLATVIIVSVLIPIVVMVFGFGKVYNNLEGLSNIPVTDIAKAVQYSVADQGKRKDFYRSWMSNKDLQDAKQDILIERGVMERKELRDNYREIIRTINRIEKAIVSHN